MPKPRPTFTAPPPRKIPQISRAQIRKARDKSEQTRVADIRGRGHADTSLRQTRMRNRVSPVENTFLGQPPDNTTVLPAFIGEMRTKGGNQAIATGGSGETITFATAIYDATRAGYTTIYDEDTDTWTIPRGLGGAWRIHGIIQWAANVTGHRQVRIVKNSTGIYNYQNGDPDNTEEESLPFDITYPFDEGDTFDIVGQQNSGGNLSVLAGDTITFAIAEFKGVL